MKIILLTDVKKVGRRHKVKEVADGYAQNVLLPKKLAVVATPQNLKRFGREEERKEEKKELEATLMKKALKDIANQKITISLNANDAGKLFESVHEKQISKALADQLGAQIPESMVVLKKPIKTVGEHPVLLEGSNTKVTVTLVIN